MSWGGTPQYMAQYTSASTAATTSGVGPRPPPCPPGWTCDQYVTYAANFGVDAVSATAFFQKQLYETIAQLQQQGQYAPFQHQTAPATTPSPYASAATATTAAATTATATAPAASSSAPSSTPSSSSTSSATAPTTPTTTQWPDSLKRYVERVFLRNAASKAKAEAEAYLKGTIQTHIKAGTLWAVDWDTTTVVDFNEKPKPPAVGSDSSAAWWRSFGGAASGGGGGKSGGGASASAYSSGSSFISFDATSSPSSKRLTKKERRRMKKEAKAAAAAAAAAARARSPSLAAGAPRELGSSSKRAERLRRFGSVSGGGGSGGGGGAAEREVTPTLAASFAELSEHELAAFTVRGTSQALEKEYRRLTEAPLAADVRSEPALRRSFEHVQQQMASGARTYEWACSQLKAIRQDLTVQHVRTAFTAHVYEWHARLALRCGDLSEFNQCQTVLHQQLYGVPHVAAAGARAEFAAYRVLYFALHPRQLRAELNHLLRQLDASTRATPEVRHALAVVDALHTDDYTRFFRLRAAAPHLSGYLMAHATPTVRDRALRVMLRAYRPSLPVAALLRALGFSASTSMPMDADDDDAEEAAADADGADEDDGDEGGDEYLTERGVVVRDGDLQCKESFASLAR